MNELQKRGYEALLNPEKQIWAFQKGKTQIIIEDVRACPPEYFKVLLNQKEKSSSFHAFSFNLCIRILQGISLRHKFSRKRNYKTF